MAGYIIKFMQKKMGKAMNGQWIQSMEIWNSV